MAIQSPQSYKTAGFKRYGSDTLFYGSLLFSACVVGLAAGYAGFQISHADPDVNKLVIVDVKRAKEEMKRDVALAKEAPKAEPKHEEAKPRPAAIEKAPPPPKLRVTRPPVVQPRIVAPPKYEQPRVVTPPRRLVAQAPRVTRPQFNAGSRLSTAGSQSTRGTATLDTNQGNTQAGSGTGSGFGSNAGQGTGEGKGVGAATPTAAPLGDAAKPPVENTAPVVQQPKPTPAVVVPPPPIPKPDPKPEPKAEPVHVNHYAPPTPAQILRTPDPDAPSFLSDEGGSGSVRVQFTVTADGSIEDVKVISSTDHRLDAAAMAAARRIKAKPAMQNGEPRDQVMTHEYSFSAG